MSLFRKSQTNKNVFGKAYFFETSFQIPFTTCYIGLTSNISMSSKESVKLTSQFMIFQKQGTKAHSRAGIIVLYIKSTNSVLLMIDLLQKT